jgi:hypothetical protein
MIPEVEQTSWMIAAYWFLMFAIAAVVMVRVTNFWADDGPCTVFEAVRATLLMGLAVFLTYDLSGYLFARLMQMPELGFVFPEGYTYWNWIREPLCLKWQVLGFVPMIRYLPVLFALTVGGTIHVLLWDIPFRLAVLAFISQIVLMVSAMAFLSLVFSFFVGMSEGTTAGTLSTRNDERRSTSAQRRNQNRADRAGEQKDISTATGGLLGMQERAREIGLRKGPLVNEAWARWESINRVFEPGYEWSRPFTRYLPLPVQDFLNGGGWLIAAPALATFGWYVWRIRRRRDGNKSANASQA